MTPAQSSASSANVPPALPPPLAPLSPAPAARKSIPPWVIVAICLAVMLPLLAIGGVSMLIVTKVRAAERESRERRLAVQREAFAREAISVREEEAPAISSEPGITYTNERVASVPWSIHVLKVDRSRKDLTFYTALARNKVLGVSLIRDQARSVPAEFGRAIAGVNGDFYDRDNPTYAGDPRGLQIVNGELFSAPDTVCVWFDPQGNPHLDEVKGDYNVTWANGSKTPYGLNQRRRARTTVLYTPGYGPSTRVTGGRELVLEKEGDGAWLPFQANQKYRARVRQISTTGNTPIPDDGFVLSISPEMVSSVPDAPVGAVVEISTATTPDLTGVQMAIAGGPAIVKDGKPFALHNPPPGASGNYSEASKYQRHPRSAVGWNSKYLFLVTVDGRQPGLSMGMKLAELGEYMKKLGCTDAMNLDGGKSAQMWMNGQILNSPHQGEDTVANSLLIVRKAQGE